MKYIEISNSGNIDINALTLMGASSKSNDKTKIGYFGSGLKYAITFLLRHNNIILFNGKKEIKFTIKKETFRNIKFDRILVDDNETSLTTSMGIDSNYFDAIREIYANAIDEKDGFIKITDKVNPKRNKVKFYITINESVQEIIDNWDKYFSLNRNGAIYEKNISKLEDDSSDSEINSHFRIFKRYSKSGRVYRKGILCYDELYKSVFDYDIPNIEISESRKLSSLYDLKRYVSDKLISLDDLDTVNYLINNIKDSEFEIDLYWNNDSYSDTWLQCCKQYTIIPIEQSGLYVNIISDNDVNTLLLPFILCNGLKNSFGDNLNILMITNSNGIQYKELQLTDEQNLKINIAIDRLKQLNINIDTRIGVCKSLNDDSFITEPNCILISEKIFDFGIRNLALCIVNGYIALNNSYTAESLSEFYFSHIEKINGIFL